MKIAVLGHRRFPIKEPFAGGIERFTHTLIKGLEKQGCQVTLFAHPDSDRSLNLSLALFCQTPKTFVILKLWSLYREKD